MSASGCHHHLFAACAIAVLLLDQPISITRSTVHVVRDNFNCLLMVLYSNQFDVGENETIDDREWDSNHPIGDDRSGI